MPSTTAAVGVAPVQNSSETEKEIRLIQVLDTLGIHYEIHRHPPPQTTAHLEELLKGAPGVISQNLVLCDKKQPKTRYLLTALVSSCVHLKNLSNRLGCSDLGVCTELEETAQLLPGACNLTPLAVFEDQQYKITVLMDQELKNHENILVHPMHNQASLAVKVQDLVRFCEHFNHAPKWIDLNPIPDLPPDFSSAEPTPEMLECPPPPASNDSNKRYITTAINYTNGPPHMGHAYEAVTSDVIARYHRAFGRNVFYVTGTDEHGQKIHRTAERMGKGTMEVCNLFAEGFQKINRRLCISNDFFVRTTMPKHYETCKWLWERSKAAGDIYLGRYKGWYNEREEMFVTETEAKLTDFKDPISGNPLSQMEESSYFFRMSKFQIPLVQHIQNNPKFIFPEFRRNEILARLQEPLADLSSSRTTFRWGVPVPDEKDHVMYVWFDALTNYLSATNYPEGDLARTYWPADVQIIGKDITWFHCVIWPCMLMSAGIPLPKSIVAHGFVTAADSRKMSKSLGNVLDPNDLLDRFSADTLRYFICRETKFGYDLKFDIHALIDLHNADLADTLGNLIHRTTSLCSKYCEGMVPDVSLPEGPVPFAVSPLVEEVDNLFENFCIQEPIELIIGAAHDTNKYLTDHAPWAMKNNPQGRQRVVRAVLEAVYVLGHMLKAILPNTTERIFEKLNTPAKSSISTLSDRFDNLTPGTKVTVGEILFSKLQHEVGSIDAQPASKVPHKSTKKGEGGVKKT